MKKFLLYSLLSAVALLTADDFRELPPMIKAAYGNFHFENDGGAGLRQYTADYFVPMQKAGFNVVDLKVHNRTGDETILKDGLKQLARTVNDHGMVLTVYTYMPYQRNRNSKLPAVINAEGQEISNRYNLLNYEAWKNLLKSTYQMAEYSRETPIAAVKVDLEEFCHSGFLIPYNDEEWAEFSALHRLDSKTPRTERRKLLEQKKLAEAYEKWIEDKLAAIVVRIRQDLHAINPQLHLGMMPGIDLLLYRAFIRELGTAKVPAIIDNWSLYNGHGYGPETDESIKLAKSLNPSNIAVSWVRYNTYKAASFPSHIYRAAWAGDGWSGWEFRMLNTNQEGLTPYYRLPLGENPADYWQAFKTANAAIDRDIAENSAIHNRLPLEKISPLVPELKLDDVTIPNLIPKGDGNGTPQWMGMRERQIFYFYGKAGEPVKFEIQHRAGLHRPNALIYAVMDMDRKILRRESVAPAEHTTFELALPKTGVGALVVTGGDDGLAWYGVKIHSKYLALPAVKGYFFFNYPYSVYSYSKDEPLMLSSKIKQVFELTIDGKPVRLTDKQVVKLEPGRHEIKVAKPKETPKGYYTQDIFFRSSPENPVYLSDHPERMLIPSER